MCVNNLSKVALNSAAAGIEPATSIRKSSALTMQCANEPHMVKVLMFPSKWLLECDLKYYTLSYMEKKLLFFVFIR